MKIKIVKKSTGSQKTDSICPWVVEVMDQSGAKIDSICPWVVEVMEQVQRS